MKMITLTIPVNEAERLLNDLPISKYPRTVLALASRDELEPLSGVSELDQEQEEVIDSEWEDPRSRYMTDSEICADDCGVLRLFK